MNNTEKLQFIKSRADEYDVYFNSPKELFRQLSGIDRDYLERIREEYKPDVDYIQPVNLMRYVVINHLLDTGSIDEEEYNSIKKAVEQKDIADFTHLSDEIIQAFVSRPDKKKSFFSQWSNPAKMLYPLFYDYATSEYVNACCKDISDEVIAKLKIPFPSVHIVDFNGPSHYGQSSVWMAIFPLELRDHQNAHQLFITIKREGMFCGLHSGAAVDSSKRVSELSKFENYDELENILGANLERWKLMNSELSNTEDETNETVLLNNLETMNQDKQYYCVGSHWDGSDPENQLPRFKEKGIWENGFDDKYIQKVKSVPVGSLLAAKTTYTRKVDGKTVSVLEIHAIGEVTSNDGDGRTLRVKWQENFKPFSLDGRGAYRSTISQVINQTNIDLIFGSTRKNENDALAFDEADREFNHHLNQILFGPPGTGKTYNTISKAVAIIDGLKESVLGKYYGDRSDVKERFGELVSAGQIAFCTFHQSMSYEDFIEGIKPIMEHENTNDELGYAIEDGIFKRMCIKAKYDFYKHGDSELSANITRAEYFNTAYDDLIAKYEEQLARGEKIVLKTKTGLEVNVTEISDNSNLYLKHADRDYSYSVSRKRLLKLFNHYKTLDDITNVHNDIRDVIGGSNATLYWAVLAVIYSKYQDSTSLQVEKESVPRLKNYETVKSIVNSFQITPERLATTAPERYVLIIDEINRGNVSQIFGELITLIEEDKRLGKSEAIEANLPYNKDEVFGVPPNLYLIGTMNTADRSIEALDTALRRRFSFEEIMPDYSIDKLNYSNAGINTADLLRTINARIEKLLDKDHQIGHSYLLLREDETEEDRIINAFYKNIIPLLQEYFFGDFAKIGLVLGKGFVRLKPNSTDENIFADFAHDSASDFAAKEVYEIVDYRFSPEQQVDGKTMTFGSALKLLMRK